MTKVNKSLNLAVELYEEFMKIAKEEVRSFNGEAVVAFQQYIQSYKSRKNEKDTTAVPQENGKGKNKK